jgi:hypothetical protein
VDLLVTTTICFQPTSGELLAHDADVIQLNVPAFFGLFLTRVANADVLVSSVQIRSPTWSADLREHEGHLHVKEQRHIVAKNYLKAGVPDVARLADKLIMNDDETTGSAQNRPQKVANMISFNALSNMHTTPGHTSAEAILRVLEGGIRPDGVNAITRADLKRVISNCTISERLRSKPLRPRAAIPSEFKSNESVHIDFLYIDEHPVLTAVCAGTS